MGEYMLMPKLDMSMKEGTIVSWLVEEGQKINKGEYAVEVETGKVSIEVDNTAFSGKVLKIYCEEGETVEVNTPIMYIGEEDETAPSKEDSIEYFRALKKENSRIIESHGFDYDVIIIGAGQAGYTFALNAAKYTDRIAVIEKGTFGGVCLNRGCIPSRFYHKRVSLVDSVRNSAAIGIDAAVNGIDFTSMAEDKNTMTFRLSQSVKHNLNSMCDVYEVGAKIQAPHIIKADGQYISSKYIVIATGSKAVGFSFETDSSIPVYNTEDMISVSELPEKIIFCGNSRYIIEQACMFSSLGSEVMLISDVDILNDNYLNRQIRKILAKSKVKLIDENVIAIKDCKVITDKDSYTSDIFVYENERTANKADSEVGFEFDDKGFYVCSDNYETNIEDIYVIGDACGKSLTAQGAGLDAEILAKILFDTDANTRKVYPRCINLIPKIAYIGKFEKELEDEGVDFVSAKRSFSSLPAAMASSDGGFMKIIADSTFGEILSVQIMSDNADEMIGIFSSAIMNELTVDELSESIFIHPTLSEMISSLCSELKEKILNK
ncbi:MAG: FAD-binding protein [Anaerofustis stercorihominis]|nr:FAD-binding protein [Anaerofustis stercorihominis]